MALPINLPMVRIIGLVMMSDAHLVFMRMGIGRVIVVSLARGHGLSMRCPTCGDPVFMGAYRGTLPGLITLHLFIISLGHKEGGDASIHEIWR